MGVPSNLFVSFDYPSDLPTGAIQITMTVSSDNSGRVFFGFPSPTAVTNTPVPTPSNGDTLEIILCNLRENQVAFVFGIFSEFLQKNEAVRFTADWTTALGGTWTNGAFDDPFSCCVHPLTNLSMDKCTMVIKDVKRGHNAIDLYGKSVDIIYNIKYYPTNDFIKINKGSLGNNIPHNDLYIREGHPLLLENKEVECQDLINSTTIDRVKLDVPVPVYSLCTKDRIFIMMEGVPVCTWAQDEWENYAKENKIYWQKQ